MLRAILKIKKGFNLLGKSISSVFRIAIMSKKVTSYRKIDASNKDILILGNGPSLKPFIEENRHKLDSYNLLCVNHFGITDYYTELKPKYYIAIAFDLFLDDVMPHFVDASNRLFNALADRTDWPLKFFITAEAKKHQRWQKILSRNQNIEIIYMNLTPIEGFERFTYRCFNKAQGMPRPHNVMIPAIFTAIRLGCKQIVLAGADHSWLRELHVDDNNRTLFFNQHFYDKEKESKQFDYAGQRYMKLHEILSTMSLAFESYHILKKYADYKEVKILNSTPGSYIDAFERCSINEL